MGQGIGVQVYRVNNLSNQSNKFKVDMNAQQYMLSGCVVLHKDINMVIVQGGGSWLQHIYTHTLYKLLRVMILMNTTCNPKQCINYGHGVQYFVCGESIPSP